MDFTPPADTQDATNGITTTSTTLVSNNVLVSAATDGIAFATAGGLDWASLNGDNVVAIAAYDVDTFTGSANTDVTGTQTPASDITVNTLRFNDPAASSVNLSGTIIVSTGGILVTANTATNGATLSGGNLQAGGGKELVVIINGTLAVVSTIVDNTTDPDGDGLTNETEFALDGNPASAASTGKINRKIASPTLVLTLPVRAGATFTAPGSPTNSELVSDVVDGVIYQIQSGTDLVN